MTSENIPAAGGRPARPGSALLLAAATALYLLLLVGGSLLGGEIGRIVLSSLNTLPFAALAVLAYLGTERFNWAWVASGFWLVVLVCGAGLVAFGTGAAVVVDNTGPTPRLAEGGLLPLALLALGIVLSIGVGVLTLVPQIRRALARVIPIDPESFIHSVALSCVVMVGLICCVPLIVLGEPPLLAVLALSSADAGGLGDRDSAGQLRDSLYGLIWTIPATVLAVGYGVRRGFRQALARLGLVRPSPRQILAGVGIALLLALAVQLLGAAVNWLWGLLGWPLTDQDALGELFAFAISPLGALVIGVTAGLGEELAVRGVLQPRLGLLLSNFFFTSLHALQYNWDSLIIVFLVGVVCGLVRRRSNTSTAAIVHGTYNFTLIMLSVIFGIE